MRRSRRLPPRPPEPPPGFMWWHGRLLQIEVVEALAQLVIGDHDFLPRRERDRANEIFTYFTRRARGRK